MRFLLNRFLRSQNKQELGLNTTEEKREKKQEWKMKTGNKKATKRLNTTK
jgi:hypothetical protein